LTREEIISCVNHPKKGEGRKQVLAFCKESRSWNDIKNSGIKGDMFSIIRELKIAGALTSENGKYLATELALGVL
jgi:hypothetical protein